MKEYKMGITKSEFENHLDIPVWLAILKDHIFKNCPKARAKTWPAEFSEAINEGADLNKIKIPFLIFIVEFARAYCKDKEALAALDAVLVELKKDVLDLPELNEARAAVAYAAAAYAAASYAVAAVAYTAAAGDDDDAVAYAVAAVAYAAAASSAVVTAVAYTSAASSAADAAASYAVASYAVAAAAYTAADAADDDAVYADAAAAYTASASSAADAAVAYAACTADAYNKFADKLLELLKECGE